MSAITSFTEESFKSQAHKLKAFLTAKGLALNYTGCLDAVAVQHGHKSWNHLHAALQQRFGPPASATSEDDVVAVLSAGYNHLRPELERITASLSNTPKTLKSQLEFYPWSDHEGNTRRGQLSCKVALDHDTTLTLSVTSDYTNDFGTACFNVDVHARLQRTGIGPTDRNGWREDGLEWFNHANVDDFSLDLSDGSWKGKLLSAIQGIKLTPAISDALESTHQEPLKDIRVEFSTRIEGFSKADLVFED